MNSSPQKLFRDTIHGYIKIPEKYVDVLIDTPHFQRLRRIEQTSMRVVYPCAHHDRFVHSLIQLLNGRTIDVDSLDYTSRDRWASGVDVSTVDLSRLLSSICIRKHKGEYRLAFYKNALSAIENVLDVKNFHSLWTFAHHKVEYDQLVLSRAIADLALNTTGQRDAYKVNIAYSHPSMNYFLWRVLTRCPRANADKSPGSNITRRPIRTDGRVPR